MTICHISVWLVCTMTLLSLGAIDLTSSKTFGERPRNSEVCEEFIAKAMDDEQNALDRRSQPERLDKVKSIVSFGAVSPGVSIQNHTLAADAVGVICLGDKQDEKAQDIPIIVERAPSGLAKTDDRKPGLSKKSIDDRLIFSIPKTIAYSKK